MYQQPSFTKTSSGYTRPILCREGNEDYGWMLDTNLFSQQLNFDSVISIDNAREFLLQMPEETKNMLLAPIKEGILDPQSVIRIKNFTTQESVAIRVKDYFQAITSQELTVLSSLPPTPLRLRKAAALLEEGIYASICTQNIYASINDTESAKLSTAKGEFPESRVHFCRHLCAIPSRHKAFIVITAIILMVTLFIIIAISVALVLRNDWQSTSDTNNSSSTTQNESTGTTSGETALTQLTTASTEKSLSTISTPRTSASLTTSKTEIITTSTPRTSSSLTTPKTETTSTATVTTEMTISAALTSAPTISTTTYKFLPSMTSSLVSSSSTISTSEQPCTLIDSFRNKRICPRARSAPLKHTSRSSGSTATIGFSKSGGEILLLAWQDPIAPEIYLSTLHTSNSTLIWSKIDQKLSFPTTNVSETCIHEHVCTIVDIDERCSKANCTEMNRAQYCCACGKPSNEIICSKPNATEIFYFPQRRPIGHVWVNAGEDNIYFSSAAINSNEFLSLIKMDDTAESYVFSVSRLPVFMCSHDSCKIMSMTFALRDGWYFVSPETFGAVVQNSANKIFFCELTAIDTIPIAWCTASALPIQSDAKRIAITSQRTDRNDGYVWYIVEIRAEKDEHHFVVYSILSRHLVEYSVPIDFLDYQYSDFKTFIAGMLFGEKYLYIVLQSSTMEHLVTKYKIV